jgi:hypothetical protein
MKRLALVLWLVAWSGWLWLGFGLHRELPRSRGPVVCRIPVGGVGGILGFVRNSDFVAVEEWIDRPVHRANVVVFDAKTGIRQREGPMPLPLGAADTYMSPQEARLQSIRTHGWVFGAREDVRHSTILHAVNVMTQDWRPLSPGPIVYVAVHPTRAWVAIVEGHSPTKVDRVVVVDFHTGRRLFSLRIGAGIAATNPPFFHASRDVLVLPFQSRERLKAGRSEHVFEVWRIADPPVLEETVEDVGAFRWPFSVSATGRLRYEGNLRKEDGVFKHYDVYDFNERRYLTTSPPSEQPAANDGKFSYTVSALFSPAISPSGKTVLRFGRETNELNAKGNKFKPQSIYEVGTGRILWRTHPFESVTNSHGEDDFLVEEKWHELWAKWFPNLKFETVACRSLEDGSLINRTAAEKPIQSRFSNVSRTLIAFSDGRVHRLPFLVDWNLLALCQTILALPLILLWAVLRLRRRRAARRQPAMAVENRMPS